MCLLRIGRIDLGFRISDFGFSFWFSVKNLFRFSVLVLGFHFNNSSFKFQQFGFEI